MKHLCILCVNLSTLCVKNESNPLIISTQKFLYTPHFPQFSAEIRSFLPCLPESNLGLHFLAPVNMLYIENQQLNPKKTQKSVTLCNPKHQFQLRSAILRNPAEMREIKN